MSVSVTPGSAEERNSMLAPSSTNVSRSTDRRYSEVVNEYMKKQNRLGSDGVQPSHVLTKQADEAGPNDVSYVSWDHPDTPSYKRACSSRGSSVENLSPLRPPSAVDGMAETKKYLSLEGVSRGASSGSASSSRAANDSFVTARSHNSPQMSLEETFGSPFSQSSPASGTNPQRSSPPSSPKMGMKARKTPPQPPPKPSSREKANPRTSPNLSQRSDMEQSPRTQHNPLPGGSGQNHRSPGKVPAINVISVGGSPRRILREDRGGEKCQEPARDNPMSPEDLNTWLGSLSSPEGRRDSQLAELSNTTPVVPLTPGSLEMYRTHLVPKKKSRDSQESRDQKRASAEDGSGIDRKRYSYSGEATKYYSFQEVQPINPKALNFENVSGRGSDASDSFLDAAGNVSYPPDETGARRYTFFTPPQQSSSGGGISLPQMLWSSWSRRQRFLGHKTSYEKSLEKQERLGWCLVVIGALLLIASAITILAVEVPAHRGGLMLDDPDSQPLQGLFQDDLEKYILTPAAASNVTRVSDDEDPNLNSGDSTSGTDGGTLLSNPPTSVFHASIPVSESSTPDSQNFVPNIEDATSKHDGSMMTVTSGPKSSVTAQEEYLYEESSTITMVESSTPDAFRVPTTKGSISESEYSIIPKSPTLEAEKSVTTIDSIPDTEEGSTQKFDDTVLSSMSSEPDHEDSFGSTEAATTGSGVPVVTTGFSSLDDDDKGPPTPEESSGNVEGSQRGFEAPPPVIAGAEDPTSSPPVPITNTAPDAEAPPPSGGPGDLQKESSALPTEASTESLSSQPVGLPAPLDRSPSSHAEMPVLGILKDLRSSPASATSSASPEHLKMMEDRPDYLSALSNSG